jgi:hypothetical protein
MNPRKAFEQVIAKQASHEIVNKADHEFDKVSMYGVQLQRAYRSKNLNKISSIIKDMCNALSELENTLASDNTPYSNEFKAGVKAARAIIGNPDTRGPAGITATVENTIRWLHRDYLNWSKAHGHKITVR